jgi:hypothetical protein
MDKRDTIPFLLMMILSLIFPQVIIQGQTNTTIVYGVAIEHSTGKPFPHAKILVLKPMTSDSWEEVFQGEADSDGHFYLEIQVVKYSYVILYAYYDDPLTPGFDYIPAMKEIWETGTGIHNLTLELWDGASLILEGEPFFVQNIENAPSTYSLQTPDTGEQIVSGEYVFTYPKTSPYYQVLGISQSCIVVPANRTFRVVVSKAKSTSDFPIDKPDHFLLAKGEAMHIDLREYSISSSLSIVKAEASQIGSMIDEKEAEGFYIAVERQRFAQIVSSTTEAEALLSQGSYDASFARLRYAYTEMQDLRNGLNNMRSESSASIFILVAFLAFTAMTTSSIFFEDEGRKVGGAAAFYALLLPALYWLYPGSRLVDASQLLTVSLLAFLSATLIATLIPRNLKGKSLHGRVPLRNLLVPVFSIAKRSLGRRRLRAVLTFVTMMMLVSSFIALTSFATGYGLTFNKVSSQPGSSSGILVRAAKAPEPSTSEGYLGFIGDTAWDVYWYPPLDDSSVSWFSTRSEARFLAPKMENLPRLESNPIDRLGEFPIFGVIGIAPHAEAEILPWNETVVEGSFLSDVDDDGVLISSSLKERLNTTVGASLNLRDLQLKDVGILDDKRFGDLRDLDGQRLCPWKLMMIEPLPEDQTIDRSITLVLTLCNPSETLVVNWRTAQKLVSSGLYVSRLNVMLEEGKDLQEYAKEMALNKGFRAWASTEDGVYLAELAPYFEGKGLPIAVPWAIVVLNVVITMLNSLYERRREINIYSSVGMSPSHIAGVFLVEVSMIGILGGGFGYLLGLAWYKAMAFFTLALQVKQKVSALWVLGAIAIAMAAVLVGGYAAIKGSTIITPSRLRKWKAPIVKSSGFFEWDIPVTVSEREAEVFIEYVIKRLRSYNYVTSKVRKYLEDESRITIIEFNYTSAQTNLTSKIILNKEKSGEPYTIKFITYGPSAVIKLITSFVRRTVIEWSIEQGKTKRDDQLRNVKQDS